VVFAGAAVSAGAAVLTGALVAQPANSMPIIRQIEKKVVPFIVFLLKWLYI